MPFDIPDSDVAFSPNQSIWMSADVDILASGFNGVGVVDGCAVTAQGSPDMTVAIAAGNVRIASGATVAVTSGNGTITTAHATNPRIDLVSVSEAGTKTVTAGTAAASPKAPDLPSGHVALAMVYVPANDTTIATNQITDKRVVLAYSGARWGSGTAFPSGPATNDRFTRTDRNIDYFYDGTRWLSVQQFHENLTGLGDSSTIAEPVTTAMDGMVLGSVPLWQPTYSIYVEGVFFVYRINTTNNGSNYWTLTVDLNGAPTIVQSTAADSINTTYTTYVASNTASTTQPFVRFYNAKTGTPGSMFFAKAALVYRLIG